MANLKEIRSRISSVSSTMKITSAMKMVSAAKLKKAQDRLNNTQPYITALDHAIRNILPTVDKSSIKLLNNSSKMEKELIIAISSNRGLCGGFNANVFKKAVTQNLSKPDIICVGKKAGELFLRKKHNVIDIKTEILDDPDIKKIQELTKSVIAKFLDGGYAKVSLIYNKFKNAATQVVEFRQLLPIKTIVSDNTRTSSDYIFEPNRSEIINKLIPQKIEIQFFEAILHSVTSEHGARMTAMHKATDNAEELKQELTLSYNRQRQAAITNEILEIVAGAEALKNA